MAFSDLTNVDPVISAAWGSSDHLADLHRLAVCARIDDDEFSYSLETLKFFFGSGHILALWMPALGLAILLRMITHRFNHQLVFPVCKQLITCLECKSVYLLIV